MFRFRKELFLVLVMFTSFSVFAMSSDEERLSRLLVLHSAVTKNDVYTTQKLLEKKDVDFSFELGNLNLLQRVLIYGGRDGDWKILNMVLEAIENKNILRDPFLLKIAIQNGCLEVVQALVRAGAPVDLKNINFIGSDIFPHKYAEICGELSGNVDISEYLAKKFAVIKEGAMQIEE